MKKALAKLAKVVRPTQQPKPKAPRTLSDKELAQATGAGEEFLDLEGTP